MSEPEEKSTTNEIDIAPTYRFDWSTGEFQETSLESLAAEFEEEE